MFETLESRTFYSAAPIPTTGPTTLLPALQSATVSAKITSPTQPPTLQGQTNLLPQIAIIAILIGL